MKKIIGILPVLGLAFAAQAEVTIGTVGNGTDYDLVGSQAFDFYNTGVTKTFDVNGDNQYGTDGYYVFGGTYVANNSQGEYNDVGRFQAETPDFVDAITADTSVTLARRNTSQIVFNDPSQGSTGENFGAGGYLMNNSNTGTTDIPMLSFSVTDSDAVSFRIGLLAGNTNQDKYQAAGFSLRFDDLDAETTDPSSSVTGLTAFDGTVEAYSMGMLFFDVKLDAGTTGTFTIYADERSDNPILNGITIDVIPEPATLGLISAFGGGILFIRRRLMI
jgi:hypothetical protein